MWISIKFAFCNVEKFAFWQKTNNFKWQTNCRNGSCNQGKSNFEILGKVKEMIRGLSEKLMKGFEDSN